jgi:hypothetical protein
MPHPPQLAGSKAIFVHVPPQFVPPAGQPATQAPFTQAGVEPEQTTPQAPQLFGSPFRLTQMPLHHVFVGQTRGAELLRDVVGRGEMEFPIFAQPAECAVLRARCVWHDGEASD